MYLREDILAPLPGDNPSGIETPMGIYSAIREAQRQNDKPEPGRLDAKMADFPRVIQIAQDALATVSKDLTLAGWLTEALLRTYGYAGLGEGLQLCHSLMVGFWKTIYPPMEDDDLEYRVAPLVTIGMKLPFIVRSTPMVESGCSWLQYNASRAVGYDDPAATEKQRLVDKNLDANPKEVYVETEKSLEDCIETLAALETYCNEKFRDSAPEFKPLNDALVEVRNTVHLLLEKKRETDPDPVVSAPPEQGDGDAEMTPSISEPVDAVLYSAEPADRLQAVAGIVAAAAFLRKREPLSPVPYLLLRGLRWGELRTANPLKESTLLEAPSTHLRQRIKRLALAKRWAELLEAGEQVMALPEGRAWLDLQRLSVAACTALGSDYLPIATSIQSGLRALLNDLPELLDTTLLDDTPAANPETKRWLKSLACAVISTPAESDGVGTETTSEIPAHAIGTPTWLARSVDAYVLAKDALAAGQEQRAFAIMHDEIGRQRSGRERFRRTVQMIELAIIAGKAGIAQPFLDDIAALIETHKLDTWEDPEQVAKDLLKVMSNSAKMKADSAEKQKLLERICRLDPVQALGAV